jgi:hypothetical protein
MSDIARHLKMKENEVSPSKTTTTKTRKKKKKTTTNETKPSSTTFGSSNSTVMMTASAKNDTNDNHNNDEDEQSSSSSDLSSVYEAGACCLCHCALDYSDRAAFDVQARHEDYSSIESDDNNNNNDDDDDDDDDDNVMDDDDKDKKKCATTDSNSESEYIYRKTDPYIPMGNHTSTYQHRHQQQNTSHHNNYNNHNHNNTDVDDDDHNDDYMIYQPNNALVYCDTCHRWYHQMCHFFPIFILPLSNFTCALCQYVQQQLKSKAKAKSSKQKSQKKSVPHTTSSSSSSSSIHIPVNDYPIQHMFRSPPTSDTHNNNNTTITYPISYYENQWEKDPHVIHIKAKGLHEQFQQLIRRTTMTTLSTLRRSKGTMDTYLFQSSQHTRNYHLGIKSSSCIMMGNTGTTNHYKSYHSQHRTSTITATTENVTYLSQELVQCIVAYVTSKYTIRTLLQSLEFMRNTPFQHRSWQALIQWTKINDHPDPDHQTTTKQDFVQRIVFPFGNHHIRRWYSVTPEYILDYPETTTTTTTFASTTRTRTIPDEIRVHNKVENDTKSSKRTTTKNRTTTGIGNVTTPSSARSSTKNGVHDKALLSNQSTTATKKNAPKAKRPTNNNKKKNATTTNTMTHKTVDKDDDSGISLDELKCCVCLCGDCTDENDLLMCDGQHCYRAFHMHCIYPPIEQVDENDDTDWFCPYCETMANLLLKIQTETNRILRNDDDDEWERRRYLRYQQQKKKEKVAKTKTMKRGRHVVENESKLAPPDDKNNNNTTNDEVDSLKSWENVQTDVFPEAEWEYDVTQRLKKQRGLRDHIDIEILLARIQGQDEQRVMTLYEQSGTATAATAMIDNNMANDNDDDDDDDDDLDVDGNFDLYSYQEERRIARTEGMVDDDTNSQVTLAELSVVEMQVSDDELAALTDVDSDNDNSENSDNADTTNDPQPTASTHQLLSRRRQSRRLRNKQETKKDTLVRSNGMIQYDDVGRMDVANIITGKRKRFHIDYRKLNDAMFHSVPASELDDDDDFIYVDPQQKDHPHVSIGATSTTKTKTTKTKKAASAAAAAAAATVRPSATRRTTRNAGRMLQNHQYEP